MKANKEQARNDIKNDSFEFMWGIERDNKNRDCIFCKRNIKGGEDFYRNWVYPYVQNANWFSCEDCFKKELLKNRGCRICKYWGKCFDKHLENSRNNKTDSIGDKICKRYKLNKELYSINHLFKSRRNL